MNYHILTKWCPVTPIRICVVKRRRGNNCRTVLVQHNFNNTNRFPRSMVSRICDECQNKNTVFVPKTNQVTKYIKRSK